MNMKEKLGLLLMIFAIPFIGTCSSKVMQTKFDSMVREGLHASLVEEQKQGLSQDEFNEYDNIISHLTLAEVCQSNEFGTALKAACEDNNNLKLIETGSYVAGGIGFFLLGFILVGGWFSRFNRYLLLLFFKPGIYGTLLLSCALIVINAGVALATLYYLPVVYFERFFPKLLFLIALGALWGIYVMFRSMFQMVRNAETFVLGVQITEDAQPKLWDYVRGLAKAVGTKPPRNIILGLEPNFYVTEAKVNCSGTKLQGRTMYLSLPLMRILTEKEIRGVIGHELGHFVGLDTKFSTQFYPIYRGTTEAIGGLTNGDSAGMVLALLPVMGVLVFFLNAFSAAESKISRDRELKADKVGAKTADSLALASALLKLHAFSDYWSAIQEKNVEMLRGGRTHIANQSKFFQEIVSELAKPENFKNLGEKKTAHPFDSHPPLSARLTNMQLTIEAVQSSALNLNPTDNGIALLQAPEEIETQASLYQSLILARRLGINLDEQENQSKEMNT